MDGLAERASSIRTGCVDPRVDNMLKITNEGRKLALDQRLINDTLPCLTGDGGVYEGLIGAYVKIL